MKSCFKSAHKKNTNYGFYSCYTWLKNKVGNISKCSLSFGKSGYKTKSIYPLIAFAPLVTLLACEVPANGILIQGVMNPEETTTTVDAGVGDAGGGIELTSCAFPAESNDFLINSDFNSADPSSKNQRTLSVALKVINNLDNTNNELQNTTNQVLPVRFEYNFECNLAGEFVLPSQYAFYGQTSFCVPQSETNDFPYTAIASGAAAIDPGGGSSVIRTRVIPTDLGLEIDKSLELSSTAESCSNTQSVFSTECQALQAALENYLNTRQPPSGFTIQSVDILDLATRLARLKFFNRQANQLISDVGSFVVLLRGRLKMETSAGRIITTSEIIHGIEICRGCSGVPSSCIF